MSGGGLSGRVSVRTRIYAGFIIVLVLLAVVGLIGVSGIRHALATFDQTSGASRDAIRLVGIDRDVSDLRRVVLAFSGNGDGATLQKARDQVKALREQLAAAKSAATDGQTAGFVTEAQAALDDYAGAIERLAGLRSQRDETLAKLVGMGGKAVEGLSEVVTHAEEDQDFHNAVTAGRAQATLLNARINIYQFLLKSDPAPAEAGTVKLAEVSKLLDQLSSRQTGARRDRTLAVAAIVTDYSTALKDLQSAVLGTAEMVVTTMPQLAERFSKATVQARQRQLDDLAAVVDFSKDKLSSSQTHMLILVIGACVGGLIFASVVGHSIVGPVRAMTDIMGLLAGGDKLVQVPALSNQDEIGAMARAVQVFKENAIRIDRLQAEQDALKRKAEEERHAGMMELADAFESSVKKVVGAVSASATQMQSSSQSMASISEETSRQSTAVAAASEQAAGNVQTVAAAAEELHSSIDEIGRQVAEAASVSAEAVRVAGSAESVILGLNESTARIGEVVDLITGIAAQTNLLALNATIEAARAGDMGKGFAVVAGEVKNLANQTARATEEIGSQIAAVQSSTNQAVEAIDAITAIIERISEINATVASSVEEQSAATSEIARNVEQAATGTREVSTNITGVHHAADQAGHAATEVLTAANDLGKQAAHLSEEVDSFIALVRHK